MGQQLAQCNQINPIVVQRDAKSTSEMISKYARMKAEEKNVDLPGGVIVTSFDPASSEFVVTFTDAPEYAP